MGYRSDDGSRSRPGSRRQPARPPSAGYGEPDEYGNQDHSRQPRHAQTRHDLPALGQQPLSAPSYGGDDWYSGDQATGNIADPYGNRGGPARGYPPSPEAYPGEGHQRFEADQYGSYSPAPYDTGSYGPPSPPGFENDAYERAFSPDGYPGPGHPSGGYPVQYQEEYPGQFPGEDDGDAIDSRSPVPPRGPRRSAKSRKPKPKLLSKTTLLSVTAGIVVLAVGGTAFVLLQPSSSNSPSAATGTGTQSAALPTASASAAACDSKLGTYCHIETRKLDPTPLSLTEVFRAEFENTSTKQSFIETGQRLDKDCGNALIGSNLQDAVNSGDCSQVLRASYVSGDNAIMGTIGVVNLNTTTAASKAGGAVDSSDFISPLTTSKGVTKKIGQGTGVVEAEYKGHYLILMWAEFTSLKSPSGSTQDHELETFEQSLVSGTINIALSERMVTGQPATASN
jgi:hypothetical protein